MNKIIPFNKDITFNNSIGEITSIALDDTLKLIDEYSIKGDLIVRGCNKVLDMENEFSYSMPVDITIDSKYDTSKCSISIDDFYYEIINENVLKVKIDLILDDLFYSEEPIKKESLIVSNDERIDVSASLEKKDSEWDVDVSLEKDDIDIDFKFDNKKDQNNVEDLFKEMNEEKEYSVYRVYTVIENDSLESIMEKYKVNRDDLADYNDLMVITPGMKLVIPSTDE